jgi:hypothetical protein
MPTAAASARKKSRRLSRTVVAAIDSSRILGVRAGHKSEHRFTGIWAVVVGDRVFVRSWSRKAGGWFRTFLEDSIGAIQVGTRQVHVRAVRVRRQALLLAVEAAYARKYATPGALKFVRGFRTRRRREATIEFVPR